MSAPLSAMPAARLAPTSPPRTSFALYAASARRRSARPARIHSSGDNLKSQWFSSRTNALNVVSPPSTSGPHVARGVLSTIEADHDLLGLDDREEVDRTLPHAHEALHDLACVVGAEV